MLHPVAVVPLVVEIPDNRRGAGRLLVKEAEGVSLVSAVAMVIRLDVKLVERPLAHAGHEAFPDAGTPTRPKYMSLRVPLIERANDGNFACVRSPHTKTRSWAAPRIHHVSPEFFVHAVVAAFVEQVEVLLAEQRDVIVHEAGGCFSALGHRLQRRTAAVENDILD